MHVDEGHSGPYVRRLLRDSFRQDGKVKHRTIANVSSCSPEEIQALKLALRHKGDLTTLASLRDATLHQGLSCGAVWVVYDLARQLGIQAALGSTRQGKLALWRDSPISAARIGLRRRMYRGPSSGITSASS